MKKDTPQSTTDTSEARTRRAWDGFICDILMRQPFARALLEHFLPAPLLAITDLDSLVLSSEKLPPSPGKTHSRQMDIVYRLKIDNGNLDLLVHIEHQSTHDPDIEQRLHDYNRDLARRYRNSPESRNRPALIFSILLYHGKTRHPPLLHWSEQLNNPRVQAVVTQLRHNMTRLVDIGTLDNHQIAGLGALAPVSMLLRDLVRTDLASLLPELTRLLDSQSISDEDRRLITLFAMLNGDTHNWPAVRQIATRINPSVGDSIMTIAEQIETLKQETRFLKQQAGRNWQAGLMAGRESGISEGIEKGIEKGSVEALRQTAMNMLSKGIDIHLVAECTGLSLQQLKTLASQR